MQVALRGQSKSPLQNYIRRNALFSLHFGRLSEQIEEDEINEYLAALARDPRSPSRSSFNPGYVIELRNEGLKCNKTATYGDEA